MAAIVPISAGRRFGQPIRVRSATAQATTGQTDWIAVPPNAKYAEVLVNVTATAGTTPIILPSLVTADPITLDDTNVCVVGAATTTGITSTGLTRISVGPGTEGVTAQLVVGTVGAVDVKLNAVLPALLGVKVLNDRTTGDETYTYTVTAVFYK